MTNDGRTLRTTAGQDDFALHSSHCPTYQFLLKRILVWRLFIITLRVCDGNCGGFPCRRNDKKWQVAGRWPWNPGETWEKRESRQVWTYVTSLEDKSDFTHTAVGLKTALRWRLMVQIHLMDKLCELHCPIVTELKRTLQASKPSVKLASVRSFFFLHLWNRTYRNGIS